MKLRLYEQRTVYVHGSPFLVRRVHAKFAGSYKTKGYSHGLWGQPISELVRGESSYSGMYVVFHRGRYLVRCRKSNLKRYLHAFALQLLRDSK